MSDLKVNFERLKTAVDWSAKQLKTPREERKEAIKQFVGSHYSDNGAPRKVPTNLIELATTIYTRQLASRPPKVMISTGRQELKPFSRNMEIALNQVPEEINLQDTLQKVVTEAIFFMGVCKVGLHATGEKLGEEYGETFVDLISIDDYFCDMSAKSRGEMQFEGNDYWISLDKAKQLYGDDVEATEYTTINDRGEESAQGVSVDNSVDLYKDKVWLRDVYLYDSGQMVTYGVKSGKLLRVIDWDGPDEGPYHTLSFTDVPGNLLPLPPVSLWRDLHDLANILFRKLSRQADAKKSVVTFPGGNEEDVEALKNAEDGEGIKYTGQKPESVTVGGIDQPTFALYLQSRDLFSYFAGNLDSLGGLSPVSDTASQDKLVSDAASVRLNSMKSSVIQFVKRIFKAIAWYEWTDPVRERIIEKQVAGTDLVLKRKWSAETRDGDFLDYNIDIDVHSMQEDTPNLRLQKLNATLQNIILPMMPMMQQQGVQLDISKLMEIQARLGDIPELNELLTFANGPIEQLPMLGNPTPSFKPMETKRTYERINRPGATRSGKDDVMSRLMMGGNVQQDEASALFKAN